LFIDFIITFKAKTNAFCRMKKWLDQLARVEHLLKKSITRRLRNASIMADSRSKIAKAEEVISRYDDLKKAIKQRHENE
jgi:hypothetical protein